MIKLSTSLRVRLLFLILFPLVILAISLGIWRYHDIKNSTDALFERSLLSAALAISSDVNVAGEYVPPMTLLLVNTASNGNIGYNVQDENGQYITGYASPPTIIPDTVKEKSISKTRYTFYKSVYRKVPVQALQLHSNKIIPNLGKVIVTVWREDSERDAFAKNILISAVIFMAILLGALIAIVWFGIYLSLRPLNSLQEAISLRSPNDLSHIRRPVPIEISGIVMTLNTLFKEVEQTVTSHRTFISNASHQLRNPIAAVLSLAESVRHAKTQGDQNERIDELLSTVQEASRMTNQLLSLERLKHSHSNHNKEIFDLNRDLRNICRTYAPLVLEKGIDFEFIPYNEPLFVNADRIFTQEAIKNLLDNALKHSGDIVTEIICSITMTDNHAIIHIIDNGVGLDMKSSYKIKNNTPEDFENFMKHYHGTGLGLSIVHNVAKRNDGYIYIDPNAKGMSIYLAIKLPD